MRCRWLAAGAGRQADTAAWRGAGRESAPLPPPPTIVDGAIIPGAGEPRWHVNASWFSGTTTPASFVAAEVIPERPIQMFAAEAPAQEVVAIRAAFEARKLAKPDDPRLVAVAAEDAIEKPG